MKRNAETVRKIGTGHAAAMGRLGIKELRAAAFPSESNIAQASEPGLYGHPTQAEVTESHRPDDPGDQTRATPDAAPTQNPPVSERGEPEDEREIDDD